MYHLCAQRWIHKKKRLRTSTLSLLEGGQGRSNPTCMQVIIHAQEWMALHRRQQEGKDKISGLVL